MKVEQGLVKILGGFGVGFHTAASIDFNVGDDAETHTYVLLDKNAQWFLKGAGGDKVQKGDVKAVKIIMKNLGRLAVLLMMCSVLQLMMCSVLQLMES